jgi:hypothetical protein
VSPIESLDVNLCRVLQWREAAPGLLLQLFDDESGLPWLGIRAHLEVDNAERQAAVVALSSSSAGSWRLPKYAWALDVTDAFELHVLKPAPRPIFGNPSICCAYADKPGNIFAAVGDANHMQFLCIRQVQDPQDYARVFKRGFAYLSLGPIELQELGKLALREPIENRRRAENAARSARMDAAPDRPR